MAVKARDLRKRGWQEPEAIQWACQAAAEARRQGWSKSQILHQLDQLHQSPEAFREDPLFGPLANRMLAQVGKSRAIPGVITPQLADTPVVCEIWGGPDLDAQTLDQMDRACRLPIAVRGAQMPDGHVGYGLPIGGVLATRNAVIPYGVGVDIACRMKISILPEPSSHLLRAHDELVGALCSQTAFGIGSGFRRSDRRRHDVMDDPAWEELPRALRDLKDKAWDQLGSSGSGNHFVEWGELVLAVPDLGLEAGRYLALLSHSGSRGFGAQVAGYFTRLAMERTHLPREARHLAWLALDSDPGQAYWRAMELAGRYASANHDLIHRHVLAAAGLAPALQIENHHNFAWIEEHDGEKLVVHRKGATPAGKGVLGIIPGSMGDPGFIVRGKGSAASLNSAAHGAGRRLSRKAAKSSITREQQLGYLRERGIELLDGGLDESPQAYKDIRRVMQAQHDLVEPVAQFNPRLVLMAPGGRAED